MQEDIQTKVAARQMLLDELEAAKPAPLPQAVDQGKATVTGATTTPGAGTPYGNGAGDVDMDAEGEDEEAVTPAGMVGRPEGNSLAFSRQQEADEDDLFGDEGTEDGTAGGTAEEDGGGEAEGDEEEEDDEEGEEEDVDHGGVVAMGEEEEEMGEEEENEMAALLRTEFLVTEPSPAPMSAATPGAEAQAQADAYNALNDFTMAGGVDAMPLEAASSPAYEYPTEGIVGMRRLAEGVDEDDESSDDSED
jgi:hypothetical protein